MNQQPVLVDETEPHKAPRKPGASVRHDLLAGLLLQSGEISLARSPPATLAAAQLASAGVLLPAGLTNLLVENTTLGISFIGAAKTSVEEGQGIALISYDECEASDRHRFSRVVSAVLVLIGALLVVRLLGKK